MVEDPTTPGQIVGRNVRAVREEQLLSRPDLAERSGVAKPTIAALELGLSAHPRRRTVEKIATALGVPVEDLIRKDLTRPKEEAPPSLEPTLWNGLTEERRSDDERTALAQVLRGYMLKRAEDHDREMRDPESPHFRTATSATLWLDDLYREMRDWCVWVYEHRAELLPPFEEGANPEFWRAAWHAYLAPLMAFQTIRKQAERRIAQMDGVPDELAARRLQTTRKDAEKAQRELESASEVG